MMNRGANFLVLVLTLLSTTLFAQSTTKETLLALSKHDQTLAIIDPVSLKILARVPVGNDPHEVIASADGKTAYVSNYGGGAYNTLAVVDLVSQKALPSIDLGPLRGPHGLTFVAGKTWFTAEAAKAIGSYDPAAGKIDWILGTGQDRTHMIYVSDDGKRIVTTNVSSGTVSIIERVAARAPGPPPQGRVRLPTLRHHLAAWVRQEVTGSKRSYESAMAPRDSMYPLTRKKSGCRILRTAPSRSSISARRR